MAGHFHTVLLDHYVGDVFSGLEALPFIGAKIGIIFHITACFGEIFMESSSDTLDKNLIWRLFFRSGSHLLP